MPGSRSQIEEPPNVSIFESSGGDPCASLIPISMQPRVGYAEGEGSQALVDIFLTFGPRVDRSVQKFAMGRRVDRPWTSRRIAARDYYRGCMRIECTRTLSRAYRTCTCERGQEQTLLYNWGTRTRWFHEQADRFYHSPVKGVCSRSTYGKSKNSHSKKVRMQPTCMYAPGKSYVTGRHGARRPRFLGS